MTLSAAPQRASKRRVLSACLHRGGCAKPRLSGERFCFDHLDLEELEAAINEPDEDDVKEERAPHAPLEVAMPTGSPGQPSPTRRIDPPWECRCGRFSTDWPASKAKHLLACDGTPVATSGRIAARHPELGSVITSSVIKRKKEKRAYVRRTPPAAKRPRKAARRAVQPPRKAKPTGRELAIIPPAQLVIPVGASARITFLDQARAARDRLDVAISAIEGLA